MRPSQFLTAVIATLISTATGQEDKNIADGKPVAQQQDQRIGNHPRPMLMRPEWKSLNGQWDSATSQDTSKPPTDWPQTISIPMESSSAVGSEWLRLQIPTPELPEGKRAVVRFESITGHAQVFANGTLATASSGSGTPLSLDFTDLLTQTPTQEIAVVLQREGKSTPAAGIDGAVWLEIIPRTHITQLVITPDVEKATVTVFARIWGQANFRPLEVVALDADKNIAKGTAFYHYEKGGYETTLRIPDAKTWSPDSPKLYGLRIRMANEDGSTHDDVTSYFAMRRPSVTGVTRKFSLNGEPLFLLGYSDPSNHYLQDDDAIRAELESAKRQGFNLIHKVGGVASSRFYHWADRLGLVVWQASPNDKKQLLEALEKVANHPSILLWPDKTRALKNNRHQLFTAGKKKADLIYIDGVESDLPTDLKAAIAISGVPPVDSEKDLRSSLPELIPQEKIDRLSGVVFSSRPTE